MAKTAKKLSDNTKSQADTIDGAAVTSGKSKKVAGKEATKISPPNQEVIPIDLGHVALKRLTLEDDLGPIFNFPENKALPAQYVRVYTFNQRVSLAKTKTRGEVRGSGRKPWRQKHTGRARVGSIRNPVWRHGGVSHGPTPRDWSLDLPKKMKDLAFATIFSKRLRSGDIYQVDKIDVREGRTKEAISMLKTWNLIGKTLVVLWEGNESLARACRNLKYMEVVLHSNLNAYQLLKNANIVFEKSALDKLREKYAKN